MGEGKDRIEQNSRFLLTTKLFRSIPTVLAQFPSYSSLETFVGRVSALLFSQILQRLIISILWEICAWKAVLAVFCSLSKILKQNKFA